MLNIRMPAAELLKLPGWYLNFSAWFMGGGGREYMYILFEQKNIKF